MYFPTSHMKLMRCFNLIIIKITSLFSYLAEFDLRRGVEQATGTPPTPSLPRGGREELRAPRRPLHPSSVKIPNLPPGLGVQVKQRGKRTGKLRK